MADLEIQDGVLIKCNSLSSEVVVPSGVTSIGASAFIEMRNLEAVVLPETLKIIGKYSFDGCKNLESINIPDSVSVIDRGAFRGCKSLKTFHFPTSLKVIGHFAFDLSGITSAELPYGVETINLSAFERCNWLENVSIPASVTKIDTYAFNRSINIRRITTDVPLFKNMLGNGLPGEIAIEDIYQLGDELRVLAVIAFANDVAGGKAEISSPRGESHMVYIKDNVSELGSVALDNPALLDILIEQKVIQKQHISEYIKCADMNNDVVSKVKLTDYAVNELPDDGDDDLKGMLGIE